MYACADDGDVVFRLFGAIRNTNAARQIDIFDVQARCFVNAHGKGKENACELGVVFVGNRVRGKEGMNAEMLCTACCELFVAFNHLRFAHAIFCIAGLIHDLKTFFAFAHRERSAGVIAAEDGFGHACHAL